MANYKGSEPAKNGELEISGRVILPFRWRITMALNPPENGELRDVLPSYFSFQIANYKGSEPARKWRIKRCLAELLYLSDGELQRL